MVKNTKFFILNSFFFYFETMKNESNFSFFFFFDPVGTLLGEMTSKSSKLIQHMHLEQIMALVSNFHKILLLVRVIH